MCLNESKLCNLGRRMVKALPFGIVGRRRWDGEQILTLHTQKSIAVLEFALSVTEKIVQWQTRGALSLKYCLAEIWKTWGRSKGFELPTAPDLHHVSDTIVTRIPDLLVFRH
jgi:hypothetical protein